MKNKSVINTPHNSAVLLPTSGNRARNTLSQLSANHGSSTSAQLQHRLWSGIAVTIVTIAATRSSRHQSVITPLFRGVTKKFLLRLAQTDIIFLIFYFRHSGLIRLVPTYILPAKEIRLLGKFQPHNFKTERLVCVETDGQTDIRTWLHRLV